MNRSCDFLVVGEGIAGLTIALALADQGARVERDGLGALRAAAERTIPALRTASVLGHWAGLRPMTPDGLPILGRDPEVPSLSCACGFSRNGILLAPCLAEVMGRSLTSGLAPAHMTPFSPDRFS